MNNSEFNQDTSSTTLVSNGLVDSHGNTADKRKTGAWKAAPYIIVMEMAERLAFFAIVVTLGGYLHDTMHMSMPDSMTHVNDWVGLSHFLTLLGAFLADAFLGRFMTVVLSSFIYAMGIVMLTLSTVIKGLQPLPNLPATPKQELVLGLALLLIALGTGGIKPCVSTFGADQFDDEDATEAKSKYSFFNWFYFAINMGAVLAVLVVVGVAQKKGPSWGFGLPALATIISIVVLLAGYRLYRFRKPTGSPLTRFAQVIVAACNNYRKGIVVERIPKDGELYEVKTKESDILGAPKMTRTLQYRFLDKAAVVTDPNNIITNNRWKLCTVTQVEEFKCIVRILPIMLTTIALSISFSQLSTYFVRQSAIMNRNFRSYVMPSGTITVFASLNPVIVIPIYVRIIIPMLRKHTGHERGITSLQRIGVGLFISIFCMAFAAIIERKRNTNIHPESMSVFWLVPQVFILGTAEVFTYVGQLEFFYDEASPGTKSISTAIFLCQSGIGHFLSAVIVKAINGLTGGLEKGWLRNNLNKSRLDYFYWILCLINIINFFAYLWTSSRYKGRDDGDDQEVAANTIGDEEDEGSSRGIL